MQIVNIKYFRLFLLTLLAVSCSTQMRKQPCFENEPPGNYGPVINSDLNEVAPKVFGGKLYYLAETGNPKNPYELISAKFTGNGFDTPEAEKFFPFDDFKSFTTPSFYRNGQRNTTVAYFAGVLKSDKFQNNDIYYTEYDGKNWSKAIKLNDSVNTSNFESQPAVSSDGNILVFASDRPGGKGNIDLYVTYKDGDDKWTAPVNLVNANTERNEMYPYLTDNNGLLFSSKGFGDGSGYDIIKAEYAGNSWRNPRKLPEPINSDFNETCAAIHNGDIIISSDRKKSCGGSDLYHFELCGPVAVDIEISAEASPVPISGILNLLDIYGNIIITADVDESGRESFDLHSGQNYIVEYLNPCLDEQLPPQGISAPCSDSSAVRIIVKFVVDYKPKEFLFEHYEVPFFVTGYYMPNTSGNLDALRMMFSHNLIGLQDSTRYIEKPGPEYDQYAKIVEGALGDAVNFIIESANRISSECNTNGKPLNITVTGFADPRALSPAAIYTGPDIRSSSYGLNIRHGQPMTNELLSVLRAYFTAKYFEEVLFKRKDFARFVDLINFKIIGKGIDANQTRPDELKRRVSVTIGY